MAWVSAWRTVVRSMASAVSSNFSKSGQPGQYDPWIRCSVFPEGYQNKCITRSVLLYDFTLWIMWCNIVRKWVGQEKKVCLVHCMPAMQPAKDLESPAGGIQGARQSHCISPVPTSSMSSDLHGTLSEGFGIRIWAPFFTHSKRGIGVSLSRQGLVQKSLQCRSGRSTPT